jgi:hypothetical protein
MVNVAFLKLIALSADNTLKTLILVDDLHFDVTEI